MPPPRFIRTARFGRISQRIEASLDENNRRRTEVLRQIERIQEQQGQAERVTQERLPQRRFGLPVRQVQRQQKEVLQRREQAREFISESQGNIQQLRQNLELLDEERTALVVQRREIESRIKRQEERERPDERVQTQVMISEEAPKRVSFISAEQDTIRQERQENRGFQGVINNIRDNITKIIAKTISKSAPEEIERINLERRTASEIESLNKRVEEFNKRFGGRELSESEFKQAQKEQSALERSQVLIMGAEKRIMRLEAIRLAKEPPLLLKIARFQGLTKFGTKVSLSDVFAGEEKIRTGIIERVSGTLASVGVKLKSISVKRRDYFATPEQKEANLKNLFKTQLEFVALTTPKIAPVVLTSIAFRGGEALIDPTKTLEERIQGGIELGSIGLFAAGRTIRITRRFLRQEIVTRVSIPQREVISFEKLVRLSERDIKAQFLIRTRTEPVFTFVQRRRQIFQEKALTKMFGTESSTLFRKGRVIMGQKGFETAFVTRPFLIRDGKLLGTIQTFSVRQRGKITIGILRGEFKPIEKKFVPVLKEERLSLQLLGERGTEISAGKVRVKELFKVTRQGKIKPIFEVSKVSDFKVTGFAKERLATSDIKVFKTISVVKRFREPTTIFGISKLIDKPTKTFLVQGVRQIKVKGVNVSMAQAIKGAVIKKALPSLPTTKQIASRVTKQLSIKVPVTRNVLGKAIILKVSQQPVTKQKAIQEVIPKSLLRPRVIPSIREVSRVKTVQILRPTFRTILPLRTVFQPRPISKIIPVKAKPPIKPRLTIFPPIPRLELKGTKAPRLIPKKRRKLEATFFFTPDITSIVTGLTVKVPRTKFPSFVKKFRTGVELRRIPNIR